MWIDAPFNLAQVQALNEYQFGLNDAGPAHPFTCANNDDDRHGVINGDRGLLIATTNGWRCMYCDYEQCSTLDVAANTQSSQLHWGDLLLEAMPRKVDELIAQLQKRLTQANQPTSPFYADKDSRQRVQRLIGIALECLYRRNLAFAGVETRPGRAFSVSPDWTSVTMRLPPFGRDIQALCRLSDVTNPSHPAFALGYHIVRTTRLPALPASGDFMAESCGYGEVTHWRHVLEKRA